MSHIRRRFAYSFQILKNGSASPEQLGESDEWKAIEMISRISAEEDKLRDLSPEERHALRQISLKTELDSFYQFIKALEPNNPLYSEKMKDAITYAVNREEYLRKILEDGHIPLTNNACERKVRPISLLRKNCLFSNTFAGGMTVGIILTLIQTAKMNGADPYFYLKYLLEKMPVKYYSGRCSEDIEQMVPWSLEYRSYEEAEKRHQFDRAAPSGNNRPSTPRKDLPIQACLS